MKNKNLDLISVLPVPLEMVERRIYIIRGQKVMLDNDLAELYQVLTKNLNKAVQRNNDRFPTDFMFQLTKKETESLRFQIGTSKIGRGGRRYLPNVFTEHGVAMLSSVLNSKRAVQMNILIIRAFIKLREMLSTHKDLAKKIEALEDKQKKQELDTTVIFKVIQKLLRPPKLQNAIGFRV